MREGGREGGRERGREGRREKRRERGREKRRKGGREGRREGGRERRNEQVSIISVLISSYVQDLPGLPHSVPDSVWGGSGRRDGWPVVCAGAGKGSGPWTVLTGHLICYMFTPQTFCAPYFSQIYQW